MRKSSVSLTQCPPDKGQLDDRYQTAYNKRVGSQSIMVAFVISAATERWETFERSENVLPCPVRVARRELVREEASAKPQREEERS